jgi:coenzyme F420-dependent glucose-6-phosphate dehydrogenase
MITLGWKAGSEQYPPNDLLEYAVSAEKAGFDALEVSDHFHPWDPRGQAAFSWTWLGAAAVKTQSIRLGSGITCPILRYHPAVIAQAAATTAVMSKSRFFLCVGTGEALNEYSATGVWPGYDIRQKMLAEAIELIRQLWTGDEVTFQGDFYEAKKAQLYTLPETPIPLYISTMVPGSAEFAGKYGDGLITVGGKPSELYQNILKQFNKGATDAGKDPGTMPHLIEVNVAFTQDVEGAIREIKKYWAGTFIPALFDQKIYTPKMSAENGQPVGDDAIQESCCISDKPEDHIQFAQRYLKLGFDQIYFHSAGPDQKSFLERYGREVIPSVRQAIAA